MLSSDVTTLKPGSDFDWLIVQMFYKTQVFTHSNVDKKVLQLRLPGGVLPNMGYIGMCGPKG